MLEQLEERHHENQAKLADARSKYKNLSQTTSYITTTTTNRSKRLRTTKGLLQFSP